MNCKNWVIVEMRRKKGSGEPVEKVVEYRTWWHWKTGQGFKQGTEQYAKQQECGGTISVSVGIEVEGGCGACGSSSVKISYKCSRCGCENYLELPQNATELGDFLFVRLAKMDDKELEKLQDIRWGEHMAHEKRMQEYREKHPLNPGKGPGKP